MINVVIFRFICNLVTVSSIIELLYDVKTLTMLSKKDLILSTFFSRHETNFTLVTNLVILIITLIILKLE